MERVVGAGPVQIILSALSLFDEFFFFFPLVCQDAGAGRDDKKGKRQSRSGELPPCFSPFFSPLRGLSPFFFSRGLVSEANTRLALFGCSLFPSPPLRDTFLFFFSLFRLVGEEVGQRRPPRPGPFPLFPPPTHPREEVFFLFPFLFLYMIKGHRPKEGKVRSGRSFSLPIVPSIFPFPDRTSSSFFLPSLFSPAPG